MSEETSALEECKEYVIVVWEDAMKATADMGIADMKPIKAGWICHDIGFLLEETEDYVKIYSQYVEDPNSPHRMKDGKFEGACFVPKRSVLKIIRLTGEIKK